MPSPPFAPRPRSPSALLANPALRTYHPVAMQPDDFPRPDLARALLPHAFDKVDAAHDEGHLARVWRNVARIAAEEGGDADILVPATILHDCVWVDKASPDRAQASRMAARKAETLLAGLGWSAPAIAAVAHAIAAHSFSAGIPPETLEARILRDADRLDAIGFIGVARCFALAGARGAALYDPADPAGAARAADDGAFALDHFRTKLFTLEDGFLTGAGRRLAATRAARLHSFYDGLLDEIR
ncbi:HD domain-containing protein [Ovoidimarina sediminis]|uniref:HD domain-containing protein n=1 Tax=Ovoidimarina sediminis TaxID=3079856 RepID=UPI00290B48E4|nr:HD domain-containing protein [Rhodophyticola sp. MJ-SS7]MDU8942584.1 HD domain-containing protein [Rhodophyticola sp. MJ-SS7]